MAFLWCEEGARLASCCAQQQWRRLFRGFALDDDKIYFRQLRQYALIKRRLKSIQ
jgi:hypothetical protein